MVYAFGAPISYTGKILRESHNGMNFTEAHFNAVTTHLIATLNDLNVAQNLIDEVVVIVMTTKDDL